MASSIRDYVSEGACLTYEQLVSRFGDPKQVAYTYVNEMETDELVQEIKAGKKIVKIAAITVAVMILIWAVITVVSYNDHAVDANGYAIVEIIEVDRKLIDEGGN